jgi:hypothetical protein
MTFMDLQCKCHIHNPSHTLSMCVQCNTDVVFLHITHHAVVILNTTFRRLDSAFVGTYIVGPNR